MAGRSVLVLGGSVAGLSSALLLARDGHRVTLVERDDVTMPPDPTASAHDRPGVAHYHQPHALIPRARRELRSSLPDVYEDLLAAGASEVDVSHKLRGERVDGDDELQYLAARRPLVEWALRKAALDQPGLQLRPGARVEGLELAGRRVRGAQVDGESLPCDLVVDALGRRTPTTDWLRSAGVPVEAPRSSDCGVVYYSRYYQCRPGFTPPDGPWFLSPRGDLGYLAYASFPGDNGTFAALLAVPNGAPEWKVLHDSAAFDTAVASVPALASWVSPGDVTPLTPVMAMAGLRNSLRCVDGLSGTALFPVGDAYGHTDPTLAHGLAFALVHAAELVQALRDHDDVPDAFDAYVEATYPVLEERFRFSSALDDERRRVWVGETVDLAHRDGAYALFSIAAGGVAAAQDGELGRVFLRRIGLLDRTGVLDDDPGLQLRIEEAFARALQVPRPRQGPTREEMLEALTSPG